MPRFGNDGRKRPNAHRGSSPRRGDNDSRKRSWYLSVAASSSIDDRILAPQFLQNEPLNTGRPGALER